MSNTCSFVISKEHYSLLNYLCSLLYEEILDKKELTYKISIKGKGTTYGEVVCVGTESLLYALYEARKMDKDFQVEFPKCPVDSGVMEAVKKAFENGWFGLTPATQPNYVTYPIQVPIP